MRDLNNLIDDIMDNDIGIKSDWNVLRTDCPECKGNKVWMEEVSHLAQCFDCGCLFDPHNRKERF